MDTKLEQYKVFYTVAKCGSFSVAAKKLFIFKTCPNLIREIKGYWWGSGDVPKKKDDHALDELRYYVMSRPVLPTEIDEQTEIQKDKERLARRLMRSRHTAL